MKGLLFSERLAHLWKVNKIYYESTRIQIFSFIIGNCSNNFDNSYIWMAGVFSPLLAHIAYINDSVRLQLI